LDNSPHYDVLEEEKKLSEAIAAETLSILLTANTIGEQLYKRLQDILRMAPGSYESLASHVVKSLEDALREKRPIGQVMKSAYEIAAQAASNVWQFAKDHPVFCTVVALGILVILMPWLIEALGFGQLGPIEGICRSFNVYMCKVSSCVGVACRDVCCFVAVDICRICACRISFFVLPATRNDLVEGTGDALKP
jgi:hypothetical protein